MNLDSYNMLENVCSNAGPCITRSMLMPPNCVCACRGGSSTDKLTHAGEGTGILTPWAVFRLTSTATPWG